MSASHRVRSRRTKGIGRSLRGAIPLSLAVAAALSAPGVGRTDTGFLSGGALTGWRWGDLNYTTGLMPMTIGWRTWRS